MQEMLTDEELRAFVAALPPEVRCKFLFKAWYEVFHESRPHDTSRSEVIATASSPIDDSFK